MHVRMFKYRLYPSKKQIIILEDQLEVCRQTYNWLLLYCRETYKETKKTPTHFTMNKLLVPLKHHRPELSFIYSQVLQNIAKRIKGSYTNFFARRKVGLKAGFPRFKKYGRYKSLTYPQKGFKIDKQKLHLSKIGSINIKLHRPIEGTIKTLTIKKMPSGKWFASFSCQIKEWTRKKPSKEVGIDIGLNNFTVLSDGKVIENPRYYRKSEGMLARLQRRLSRTKKGSRNRDKAYVKVARWHEKIQNRRTDFLHKTSKQIADNYETVYVEDLKIRNMVKNHKLAKSILDASWNKFIMMIAYKAESAGGRLVKVNPRNTTQLCSQCDEIVEKTLSTRTHDCPHCGLVMDRDLNASKNILKIGQELSKLRPVEEKTPTLFSRTGQVYPMNQEAFLIIER